VTSGYAGCLFDLYDTLVYFDEGDYKAKVEHCSEIVGVNPAVYSAAWKSFVVQSNLGQLRDTAARATAVLAKLGVPAEAELVKRLVEVEHSFLRTSSRLFGDSVPTLAALRAASVQTGIVTNASASVSEVLTQHGLTELVNHVVISSAVGFRKPDHQIYKAAIARLGLEPERIVFVGDGNDRELDGAKGVGLRTIRISRNAFRAVETQQSDETAADQVIVSLGEALPLFGIG
jgi:putative hydrolase of the HAD superfamily